MSNARNAIHHENSDETSVGQKPQKPSTQKKRLKQKKRAKAKDDGSTENKSQPINPKKRKTELAHEEGQSSLTKERHRLFKSKQDDTDDVRAAVADKTTPAIEQPSLSLSTHDQNITKHVTLDKEPSLLASDPLQPNTPSNTTGEHKQDNADSINDLLAWLNNTTISGESPTKSAFSFFSETNPYGFFDTASAFDQAIQHADDDKPTRKTRPTKNHRARHRNVDTTHSKSEDAMASFSSFELTAAELNLFSMPSSSATDVDTPSDVAAESEKNPTHNKNHL